MKVFVYYHSRRKCWSVKSLEGPTKGKVIAHKEEVILKDITFKVSEVSRQKVIKTKRKNVHAGLQGTWVERESKNCNVKVVYNPYKYDSFIDLSSQQKIFKAEEAILKNKQVYVCR